ncbi:MAG: hypothetical protein SFY92_02650, partial [Verrucomicrobiae bacterium]|nr:hypothetical protein [Verrucomicrobiae bacterium]
AKTHCPSPTHGFLPFSNPNFNRAHFSSRLSAHTDFSETLPFGFLFPSQYSTTNQTAVMTTQRMIKPMIFNKVILKALDDSKKW